MPTDTFYHLPKEKRERLLAAIRRELCRAPFDCMSINRIVKDAGIPRGSYYQYFRGKQDLYGFVLEDLRLMLLQKITNALTVNGGDLFSALVTGYDAAVEYANAQESATLFANLLTGFGEKCRPTPGRLLMGENARQIFDAINLDRLHVSPGESLTQLVELSFLVLISALAELFLNANRAKELRENLLIRLHFIEFGAAKPAHSEDCPHAC